MRLLCRLPWPSAREPPTRPASVHSNSTNSTFTAPDEPSLQPKSTLGLSPLSDPEHPDIDLVFVHGLGGDARKTWGTTDGQSGCWPADWLPLEDGFDRIRIQTFGYDTKFLKGPGNCLNVHHLGKLLLGELETSPTIRLAKTKIVFIAHSMGGLVVKKAFLLAKKDPTYHELAERIESIVFLACPHHGADSAKLLRRVLSPVYDRQYLADLERNSPALQDINNDFRKYASDLALWSFYETQKMNRWTPLVVDETSAVLNYPDEKQRPMVADHRSICKFSSPRAPNYLTIRNSLAFVVNGIRTKTTEGALLESATQGRTIRELLGYNAPTDDVLDSLSEKREPGSCDWMLSNDSFMSWTSQSQKGSILLWISGKPGWGKSTLASFVVEHLQDIGCRVHSYFFQFSTHRKSTFEDCLRSLSYQIALSNESCRKSLLRLHAEGVRLDGLQARPFWNTMAQYGAFDNLQGRQYCVIDGLDECGEPQVVIETLAQILEETSSAEFRLLVIGRELPGLQSYTFQTGRCIRLALEASHTSAALAKVVRSRIPLISTINETDRDEIGDRIVQQAHGSFLFADLILQDLAGCHDQAEISRALESLPGGMEPVYSRIVESIARNATSKELSHAILSWIICASRPLTVHELQIALEIDLGTTFPHLRESITTLCGQLVTVDQIGRIKLQHETARDFLLNYTQGADFSFEQGQCNARIARTCLKLFLKRDFRRNLISGGTLAAFDTYALLELPLHLSKAAESSLQELLDASERFFKSHILDWVKVAIQYRGPGYLNVTSERLSLFCVRCPSEAQSSRSSVYVSRVAVDLLQISRKFGGALASDPSAIHTTVPLFCPSKSTIYKARKQNANFQVVNNLGSEWSGTLSSLALEYRAVSVAAIGLHLAIGLRFGVIVVFNTTAYKQVQRFEHREELEHIAFSKDGSYLASSSKDSTKVWSLAHGQSLHHFHHNDNKPLGLAFDGNRLLTPRRDDICFAWDLRREEAEEPLEDVKTLLSDEKFLSVTISTSARLAVSSKHDLKVLDLDTGELIQHSIPRNLQHTADAKKNLFIDTSLNPVNGLLAMLRGYDLLILDLRQNEVLQRCESEGVMLTTSCNGRLVAVLETKPGFSAAVKIYDFDSLSCLHELSTGTDDIEFLSFAKNDTHLVGVYGRHANQCLVWELPQDMSCLSAVPDNTTPHEAPLQFPSTRIVGLADIEALLAPPDESFILCARADGAVAMFDATTADFHKIVFQSHRPIRCLEWWPALRAVLCVSIDNTVTLQRLPATNGDQQLVGDNCIFRFQVETRHWIFDLCIAQDEEMFLLSDMYTTFAYSQEGKLIGTASFTDDDSDRRFAVLPELSGRVLCLDDQKGVRILSVSDKASTVRDTDITGFVEVPWRKSVYSAFNWQHRPHFSQDNHFVVTQGSVMSGCHGPKGLLIRLDLGTVLRQGADAFLASSTVEDQVPGTPVCYSDLYNVPVHQIIHVLDDETVLFIDDSMWLCSLNLATAEPVASSPWADGSQVTASLSYNRHFFIPTDFFKGEEMEASCAMVGSDLALALNGRPILVKGFLDHKREVRFDSYVSFEVLYASRSPRALADSSSILGPELRASL